MKVIFLDVDGVLINRDVLRLKQRFDFPSAECKHPVAARCVRLLNEVIAETNAKIVVSSCWRIGRTVQQLKDLLENWGVEGEVIDQTPCNWDKNRGWEIQLWLDTQQHGAVENFVIIDDDKDMPLLLDHLAQTEFESGLTRKEADLAIQILKRRTNEVF